MGTVGSRRRRFADRSEDVRRLTDALALHRFAIYGYSLGGPHALSCGVALSIRVSKIAISGNPFP